MIVTLAMRGVGRILYKDITTARFARRFESMVPREKNCDYRCMLWRVGGGGQIIHKVFVSVLKQLYYIL